MIETQQEASRFGLTALLGADAIALLLSLKRQGTPTPTVLGDFFSYFTVQANLAVVILLALMLSAENVWSRWPSLRGAVTSYIGMTGIVYEFVLAPNPLDFASNIPDTILHVLTPIALITLWIVEPPQIPISYRSALLWLAYPLCYVAYTLLRGGLTHWYPYYFLNPSLDGGYLLVAGWVLILTLVAAAIVLAVVRLARIRGAR